MKNLNLEHRSVLPKTGQTVEYASGDDGTYQAGNKASPRFVDNGDGTVTDNATGLMWIKNPVSAGLGIKYWEDALGTITALTYAGHSDWRMPNIKEALSIVDYERLNPALDPTYFTFPANRMITSSTDKSSTIDAWVLDYTRGTIGVDDKTETPEPFTCVRLGNPAA